MLKTSLLLAIILCCSLEGSHAASWNMEQDLPRELLDISNRLAAPRSFENSQALARDIQNVNYEISQAILSADSPDWVNPSEERRAIIERAGNALQPYSTLLVQIAFEGKSTSRDASRQCLSLLDYAKPDAQFRQVLEQQARSNYEAGLVPFRLLFEHRLLDAPLRELAADRIGGETNADQKTTMSIAAAEMGFAEAIPACEQLLSKPFSPEGMGGSTGFVGENELTMGYKRAADAILYLGPKANALLPLLVKRRDEMLNALGADAAGIFIGKLESAIDAIQGQRPIATPVAVNGSGTLTEIVGSPVPQSTPLSVVQKPSSQSTSPLVPTPQAQSAPSARPEQTRSPLLWLVCSIILLVVASGILLRALRK